MNIPFNRPTISGRELEYIRMAVEGSHVSGDGVFTARCRQLLEERIGAPRALLTTSCTHALEMAALLLDLSTGDEVIVPSFTFVSTANAFALRGARPVFVDVRQDTLNIDETRIEAAITDRTRAIVVVHYAGVGCEMDTILEIGHRRGVPVIEDNAHGLFGTYRRRPLGSFGVASTLSFHETKNITCGEGGALVVNDPAWIDRAEIIREKGTNRARFFRGQIDKYTWVDLGSSYLLSDILAAFLLAQLESCDTLQADRHARWASYHRELAPWAAAHDVRQPQWPAHCEHPAHLYYLLLPDLASRQSLLAHLNARGVNAVFHYQPLHRSEMGLRFGGALADCPVTDRVGDCLLRLPLSSGLSVADQAVVLDAVTSWRS